MARLYEGREQVVLEKLDVSKEEYAASLETHKKNPKIEQDVNEIISMMERTIKGRCPDMSVPAQVYFSICRLLIEWVMLTYVKCILKCAKWFRLECGRSLNIARKIILLSIAEMNFTIKRPWKNWVSTSWNGISWSAKDSNRVGEVQMKFSINFSKLKSKDLKKSRPSASKSKNLLTKSLKKSLKKLKISIRTE